MQHLFSSPRSYRERLSKAQREIFWKTLILDQECRNLSGPLSPVSDGFGYMYEIALENAPVPDDYKFAKPSPQSRENEPRREAPFKEQPEPSIQLCIMHEEIGEGQRSGGSTEV